MRFLVVCFTLNILSNSVVFAETAAIKAMPAKLPGNIAFYIAKTHYQHPVRLLHPYLDVWHMKGPMLEKVALKTLPKHFSNINLCNDSNNADVVLLLEPQMFYNPQLRVFHAEITARAFTNVGNASSDLTQAALTPVTTIKKQSQQIGDLAIKPDFYMEKAYTKAIVKVITTLEADQAFLATLNHAHQNHAEKLCDALDNLPATKIYY